MTWPGSYKKPASWSSSWCAAKEKLTRSAKLLSEDWSAWRRRDEETLNAEDEVNLEQAPGRKAWTDERDKEKANKVAQQVRRAASLTAELTVQSEEKLNKVCEQPPGLHDDRNFAQQQPPPVAQPQYPTAAVENTNPSVTRIGVKVGSRSARLRTPKRGPWQARAEADRRLKDEKDLVWEVYKSQWDMKSREKLFYAEEKGLKQREEFEKEFTQRVSNTLVTLKALQEWTHELETQLRAEEQRRRREKDRG